MSGTDLVIQRLSDHNFDGIAVSSAIGPIVLAELDVSQFREGTLEVLIKDATIPTGATITIDVYATARTEDDPSKMYIKSQTVATASISASVTSATLTLASFATNFGATVAVAYTATRAAATGSFKSTFETRVSLKD